jgi:hypothetical protein
MMRAFTRPTCSATRRLCAALAVVVTLASLPTCAAVILVQPDGPSFTLDICHPLPGFDRAPDLILLAWPNRPALAVTILDFSQVPEFVPGSLDEFIVAPDSPPPRSFA